MKIPLICVTLLLILLNENLKGQSFGTIYSSYELDKFQKSYQKSNREMLDKALIPFLNSSERSRLQYVRLNTPKTHQYDPLAFYTNGQSITMSAQSMMFLWDICLAFTWLNNNGYDIGTVTDYVAMLRYKRPSAFPGGKYPTPLKALGIPSNAENNQRVYNQTLSLFNSCRAAILAHELGHIYHKHPGNTAPGVSRYESRQNEMEADEFALDLLSRHPEAPVGWLLFQQITSHFNWDSDDSTHPSSAARINNTAKFIESNINDFARNGNSRQLIYSIAGKFRELAKLLGDEELQKGIQAAAEKATIASLQSTRMRVSESYSSKQRFSGEYRGSYIRYLPNRQQETLNTVLILKREGQSVSGAFNFGLGNGIIAAGQIINNKLYFNWSWAGQTGKGILGESGSGSLKGTWGYAQYIQPESNGGQWILEQK